MRLAMHMQEAFVERKYLCLVMAYCDSGDLKARIQRAAKRSALGALVICRLLKRVFNIRLFASLPACVL